MLGIKLNKYDDISLLEHEELNKSEKSLFEIDKMEWLSLKQASKLYPIGLGTFYKYKQNGLPVRRLGRKLLIKKSELDEWIDRWSIK